MAWRTTLEERKHEFLNRGGTEDEWNKMVEEEMQRTTPKSAIISAIISLLALAIGILLVVLRK